MAKSSGESDGTDVTTPVPYESIWFDVRSDQVYFVSDANLSGQDTVHGQYVHYGVYREGSLDLRTDKLRALQLKQLFDLMYSG